MKYLRHFVGIRSRPFKWERRSDRDDAIRVDAAPSSKPHI